MNQADKKYIRKARRTASTFVFIYDLTALKDDSEFERSFSEINFLGLKGSEI